MLETFILEIETVLHQSLFEELGDVIQCHMHEDNPRERYRHVENNVQRQCVEPRLHRMTEQPYGQHQQGKAAHERVQDLPPGVELQVFLGSGADTGNTDQQHRGDLAVHEVAVVIDGPPFDTSVNVAEYAAPVVQHGRVDGILEKLHQYGDIHHRTEYPVKSL